MIINIRHWRQMQDLWFGTCHQLLYSLQSTAVHQLVTFKKKKGAFLEKM